MHEQLAQHLRSSEPKGHPPTRRRTWGNFEETRDAVGKIGALEHKSGNISETLKIEEKLLWRAYKNSPTLFRTVPSPPP